MQRRKNMTKFLNFLCLYVDTLIIFISIFLVVTNGIGRPYYVTPWPCERHEDCETKACYKPLTAKCVFRICRCVIRGTVK